jgi:hypothetical protein
MCLYYLEQPRGAKGISVSRSVYIDFVKFSCPDLPPREAVAVIGRSNLYDLSRSFPSEEYRCTVTPDRLKILPLEVSSDHNESYVFQCFAYSCR